MAHANCVIHGKQNRRNWGDLPPQNLQVTIEMCFASLLEAYTLFECNLAVKNKRVKWPIGCSVKILVGFMLAPTLRFMNTTD